MSKTVMVIFGGNSTESEISVISGVEALNAMPSKGIKSIPIYIRDSKWYTGEALYSIKFYKDFNPKDCKEVSLMGKDLYTYSVLGKPKRYSHVDCALLVTHGGDGEDGRLQGFLELNGVPYSSPSAESCALLMDKYSTKVAVKCLGIPVVPGRVVAKPVDANVTELLEELYNYPMMVKPITQGSSIGIKRVNNLQELEEGLDVAFAFGDRVLAERGLRNFSEINCGAVSIGGDVIVSNIEKPITAGEFLSFEDKYLGGGKGMTSARREFPANIPANIAYKVKKYTEIIYGKLNLKGIVRMDYLLEGDDIFLNEINAIPGSLAHYLFNNLTYTELLKAVIGETLQNGLPLRYIPQTGILKHMNTANIAK